MRRFLSTVLLATACLLWAQAQAQFDPRTGNRNANGGVSSQGYPAPTTTPTITNRGLPGVAQQATPGTPLSPSASQAETLQRGRPDEERQAQRGARWCVPENGLAPEATASGSDTQSAQTATLTATGEPLTGYQEFLLASTGELLCPFGHDLFLDVPSTFAPLENVPVAADYVVGPGDELHIRGWGQVDIDFRAVVDRNGTINIPRVGDVRVAGVRAKDLNDVIRNAVSQVFRNFELSVSLGKLRSVQIFVVGQARRPGTYTVSSLSTLVNAIFAAGGPSVRGSMRSIQLKRGKRTITDLDLYDLILRGDKSKDVALLPGDVIYFPPVGPVAALAGAVNTPAIFELKRSASVSTLIGWGGGLATTAQTLKASIERIQERRTRVVDTFSLDAPGLARTLKDGDLVTVLPILAKFENAVTLRGNVAFPLRYPYTPGMRVRDLIPEPEALVQPEYYLRRNLTARTDVKSALELRFGVKQSVLGEVNWDYAVIERLNRQDLRTQLIPFDLGKAILEGDPAQNLPLEPGDVVTIFSKSDINVPQSRQTRLVRLEGEFIHAGVYQAQPGETLRQLVTRVGGLSPEAYLFGSEFTRVSTREQQARAYQRALDRLERDAQAQLAVQARSATRPQDAQSLVAQQTAQQALIARLRQLKPEGRIALEMPRQAKLAHLPDIPLEEGDRLYVPPRPAMVNVFGSVFYESSFLHRPEKSAEDYIAQAGGTTKRADTGQIFVVHADGSVTGSGGWTGGGLNSTSVMPGDTIVVPEDFEYRSWTAVLTDWAQIFYQFGLGMAALKVIKDL